MVVSFLGLSCLVTREIQVVIDAGLGIGRKRRRFDNKARSTALPAITVPLTRSRYASVEKMRFQSFLMLMMDQPPLVASS
jgi:hypothetical protein